MNRVGAFSFDAKGSPCFHEKCDDLEALCLALNEGVTGGPYTAVWAWAGEPGEVSWIDSEGAEHAMPYDCAVHELRRLYEMCDGGVADIEAPPPPECNTEAERRAYAFGWFKALEAQRNGGAA